MFSVLDSHNYLRTRCPECMSQCPWIRFPNSLELRLQVRQLLLPRLIKQSFDQIRQAAADNPAVLIRLLSTIGRLSSKMKVAEDRNALLKQATAVWETATSRPLATMDREDIEAGSQSSVSLKTDAESRLRAMRLTA